MIYIFNQPQTDYSVQSGDRFNASSKAREDISLIFERNGAKKYNIYIRFASRKLTKLYTIARYVRLILSLRKGDELIVQYPVYRVFVKSFFKVVKIVKRKGVKLTFIIHDLNYLRGLDRGISKEDFLKPLYLADLIVAHTPNMRDHLIGENITSPINIIYLFDYLTDDTYRERSRLLENRDTVVYAGNLKKSAFLKEAVNCHFKNVRFNIYGYARNVPVFRDGFDYKGAFEPEQTSYIEGGWGLCWDGESVDSCEGKWGEYLRYNSPHKLSLYLAAGIPVIVWKESALAPYIVSNKIGIAISSLRELDMILPAITKEEYLDTLDRVMSFSVKIRKGDMTMTACNMNKH